MVWFLLGGTQRYEWGDFVGFCLGVAGVDEAASPRTSPQLTHAARLDKIHLLSSVSLLAIGINNDCTSMCQILDDIL